jgi:hypothetical protein
MKKKLPGQDSQEGAAWSGQDCQDKSARIRQPGNQGRHRTAKKKNCQDKIARKGHTGKDSKKTTANASSTGKIVRPVVKPSTRNC